MKRSPVRTQALYLEKPRTCHSSRDISIRCLFSLLPRRPFTDQRRERRSSAGAQTGVLGRSRLSRTARQPTHVRTVSIGLSTPSPFAFSDDDDDKRREWAAAATFDSCLSCPGRATTARWPMRNDLNDSAAAPPLPRLPTPPSYETGEKDRESRASAAPLIDG